MWGGKVFLGMSSLNACKMCDCVHFPAGYAENHLSGALPVSAEVNISHTAIELATGYI